MQKKKFEDRNWIPKGQNQRESQVNQLAWMLGRLLKLVDMILFSFMAYQPL